jgi:GrpB-like predicted nucleotidyltransferase (UPF0157 family)
VTETNLIKRIEVVPYDPNWPAMFEAEKEIISAALGDNCIAIHHVGSTAVPGLAAKPKIDIVAAAKDRKAAILNLEKNEYIHQGEWNIPLKCAFSKRGSIDTNLHLFCDESHPEIELNLKFRDYLRTHPEACDEYVAIKMKILEDEEAQLKFRKSILPVYTIRKRSFIDNIIKNIEFDRLRVLKCATEDEWEAAKDFRERYFNRIGTGDSIDENFYDDPNHEHFMLYRGVEIIGYSDLHIISPSEVKTCIFENSDPNAAFHLKDVIKEWTQVHGYKSAM